MKEFIAPTLIDLDINETAEGVYAGSGAINTPPPEIIIPTPTPTDHDCWTDWKFEWAHHDTGTLSSCHVSAKHFGAHQGGSKVLTMYVKTNFPFKTVQNASGCDITRLGDRLFSLSRSIVGNNNEGLGFNFEIIVDTNLLDLKDESNKPLGGAIGANNALQYFCELHGYTFC